MSDTAPRIPLELISEVVNHLSDDRSSLGACSLAASILRTSSQRKLYSTVALRISNLHRILITNPDIASYMENLVLTVDDVNVDVTLFSPAPLFSRICKLKVLSRFNLPSHNADFLERILRIPSLIDVDLSGMLGGVEVDSILPLQGPSIASPQLRRLIVGPTCGSLELLRTVNTSNLVSLEVCLFPEAELLTRIQALIDSASSTLTKLVLLRRPNNIADLSLARLQKLSSLSVSADQSIDHLCDLLALVPNPRKLRIVEIDDVEDLDDYSTWTRLDRFLMGPLDSVVLSIGHSGRHDESRIWESVALGLPNLKASNRIKLVEVKAVT
ncbi:hypothetical protein DXG01_015211 [Tephrocybe rancida]|nr:hypothetical protein DXG01_015211 [Tephrocybe rancida]